VSDDLHTATLHRLIDRIHESDSAALEELFQSAAQRLERLARSMLRKFPCVRNREQTGDIVQEAAFSLLPALRQLKFSTTREFFGLVAEHMRRRLLDLHRRHVQPHRNHAPLPGPAEAILATDEDEELDRWQALHEVVANLPADQREAFSLRLYHGCSNEQIAALLQVSTRTVTRLLLRAQFFLTQQLGNQPAEESSSPKE
jgi:RNA polymerase sigma factor (sigma-70 family)